MTLRLNGSTSGYSEIEAPAVAGDQTFTLPGAGGNLITDVSDLTTQVKTATNASGSAPIYACRAWVNFDGTTAGTNPAPVTIRGSGNVSSVTRNSLGDFTVNFTTAMPDENYAFSAATQQNTPEGSTNFSIGWRSGTNKTATQIRLQILTSAGNAANYTDISLAIFR
jgi:hypothetical protein